MVSLAEPPGGGRLPAPGDTLVSVGDQHGGDAIAARRKRVAFAPGDRLGRYVIVRRVGAGGMGVVFEATDPELDRRLALKVLPSSSLRSTAARERLLAEARALAQLSHPNVVTIYDVGKLERSAFIAMEFIDGVTLTRHREIERPRWPAALDIFIRVGRGLAAVHRAGLVHRDVKPDNIMIGHTDRHAHALPRVCLMDFGLARHGAGAMDSSDDLAGGSPPETAAQTRDGGLVGTPAYIAPEQHAGLAADAKSDQFSFCVALYEMLWNEHPFASGSLAALALSVSEGRVREPPRSPAVPKDLRDLVLRGLQKRPEDRHASMDDLVASLEAQRRRPLRAGVGTAALGIAAIATASVLASSPESSVCSGAGSRLQGTWDDERAARVELALRRAPGPDRDAAWDRVRPQLDAWADAWASEHRDACEATRVHGGQSEREMDLRIACLERRRRELHATTSLLAAGDPEIAQRAGDLVAALPDLRRCSDPDELQDRIEPPATPELREHVETIRDALASVRVLVRAGRYADAKPEAVRAEAAAQALGYRPLLAEARVELGHLAHVSGDHETAERVLEGAHAEALAAGHDRVALQAATELVRVVGGELARHDDGLRWAGQARALLDRTEAGPASAADLLDATGVVEAGRGRHEEAREAHAEALRLRAEAGDGPLRVAVTRTDLGLAELSLARYEEAKGELTAALHEREAVLGPWHPEVAVSLNNLGNVWLAAGKTDEALAHFERALQIRRRVLGPEHPHVGSALTNVGNALIQGGDLEGALARQQEALELWLSALGADHPHVAMVRTNMAVTLKRLGRLDEALVQAELAVESEERTLGPDHPSVGMSHGNLGHVLDLLGRPAEAEAHLRRAHAVLKAAMGPDHPTVGQANINLAIVLAAGEHWDEVLEHATEAIRTLEAALGARHPDLFLPLSWQGRALVELKRPTEAITPLERALEVAGPETQPDDRAATHLALATALWDAERDRDRARSMAEAAYADAAPSWRTEALAWLDAHPDPLRTVERPSAR
jgi:tetratricopeptide (TPR) repeat protein